MKIHIPAERSTRALTVELLGKEGPGILVTKDSKVVMVGYDNFFGDSG